MGRQASLLLPDAGLGVISSRTFPVAAAVGRYRWGFAVALLATLVFLWLPASEILAFKVWVASWLPGATAIDALDATQHADKLVHATLFATLGVLAWWGWCRSGLRWGLWAALLALAPLTEAVQTWVPGRGASGFDMLADALGLVLGAWAANSSMRLGRVVTMHQ